METFGTPIRARLLLAALALVASFAIGAERAPGASAAPIGLGVYHCPSSPAYTACSPTEGVALDDYQSQLGRYPDIAMNYRSLDEDLLSNKEISDQEARQVTPMITVEPYVGGYGNAVSMAALAKGSYDDHIHAEAKLAKSFNGTVLIRFAHEMNGDWYGRGAGGGSTAQDYVAAWQHYVSVFREDGASNVEFVWAPNIDGGSYPFSAYFPGDPWVDHIALDGYNWGSSGSNTWQSFSEAFSSSYATLTQLSSKPVMITETASSEVGGDKAAWIRETFLREIPQQFPRVSAVIWFNRDFTGSGEQDWRINSSTAAAAAYREVVSNSLYGGPDPAPVETTPGEAESPAPPTTPGKRPPRRNKKRATVTVLRLKSPERATAQVSRTSGRVAAAPRRKAPKIRVVYRLSRPAPVRIAIRAPKRAKPVARVTIRRFRRKGAVRLSRLVRGRALKRGAYRLVARAIDDSGARSRIRRARFRVF